MGYAHENTKGRLKPVCRLSDDLSFSKTTEMKQRSSENGLTVFRRPLH
ncbi:hypothetical protein [Neisseria sp. HMSC065D04]|nr:hypothetical protein [Neisseria sp. HMSC065D04]